MESTIIFLFFRRISKSVSKSSNIVLANNNLNWVDVVEEEKQKLKIKKKKKKKKK